MCHDDLGPFAETYITILICRIHTTCHLHYTKVGFSQGLGIIFSQNLKFLEKLRFVWWNEHTDCFSVQTPFSIYFYERKLFMKAKWVNYVKRTRRSKTLFWNIFGLIQRLVSKSVFFVGSQFSLPGKKVRDNTYWWWTNFKFLPLSQKRNSRQFMSEYFFSFMKISKQ